MPLPLLPLLAVAILGAQDGPRITVGPNTPVGGDPTQPHLEPHLAVHPRDPDRLVAVAMRADSAWYGVVAFGSGDGGRSWRESPLPGCDFDPWVVYLPSGEALVSCLGRAQGPTPIFVFRSADDGRTWKGPVEVPLGRGSFDHPSMVADTTGGAGGPGTAYLVALQAIRTPTGRVLSAPALSRSVDGGRSFSLPVRLQATNVWANALNPVVLPDGSVGFGFVDYAVEGPEGERGRNVRELVTPRAWWTRSTDGGRTLGLPSLMTELEDLSSHTTIAVDGTTGRHHGRLYFVVDDVRDGAGGVFACRSADLGETWSCPSRLSRDQASGVRRLPTAAVNPRGELLVTWFEPRGATDRRCWQLMASASLDGGETFLNATPVAEMESCNDVPGNLVTRPEGPFNVASRWPVGGDYYGLLALPDGSFRALWSDSRTGVFQLWTARIDVTG